MVEIGGVFFYPSHPGPLKNAYQISAAFGPGEIGGEVYPLIGLILLMGDK